MVVIVAVLPDSLEAFLHTTVELSTILGAWVTGGVQTSMTQTTHGSEA